MQIERLMQRSGLSRHDAEQRLAAQMPIGAKAATADHVIDTSGTLEETEAQVAKALAEVRAEA
jgi:dephospho-CoA kinase